MNKYFYSMSVSVVSHGLLLLLLQTVHLPPPPPQAQLINIQIVTPKPVTLVKPPPPPPPPVPKPLPKPPPKEKVVPPPPQRVTHTPVKPPPTKTYTPNPHYVGPTKPNAPVKPAYTPPLVTDPKASYSLPSGPPGGELPPPVKPPVPKKVAEVTASGPTSWQLTKDDLENELHGIVIIHLNINGEGKITPVLVKSTGTNLDQEAMSVARKWKGKAGKLDTGETFGGEITLTFTISDDQVSCKRS